MKNLSLFFAAIFFAAIFSSCKTDSPSQVIDNSKKPSFQLLEEKVLTPTCSGCHTVGSMYALESGLVLDTSVAYASLVNVKAHESHASADGLIRVVPGSADSSFLYMKLHELPNGKEYGSHMPIGYRSLTIGQQQFIKEWINAGASKTAIVPACLPSLLDDTTYYAEAAFTPLAPPAPGTGFQITTGKFDVAANFEREIFVYKQLGNQDPIYINHIHTKMRPNSHHLVLYTFPQSSQNIPPYNTIRDLHLPNGTDNFNVEVEMQDHIFVGGSMVEEGDYWFPPGVALPLEANVGIDFNTHFINRTSNVIPGECYANIYTVDPANVQNIAYPMFSYSPNITLPPHQETTVSDNAISNTGFSPVHVFMLTSHNHEWGKKFQIYITGGKRNGELVYENTDWSHPLIKSFDPPIVLNRGEGVKSVVTYFNNTSKTISFGLKSTDEMDVIYGYYY